MISALLHGRTDRITDHSEKQNSSLYSAKPVLYCKTGILYDIMHGGIPFPLTVPEPSHPVREKMTKTQFDRMPAAGLEQAKADDSYDFDEFFDELEE